MSVLNDASKYWILGLCLIVGLSACGDKAASHVEARGETVNFYNWFNDVNPDALAEFTRATGIAVVHDVYDSDEVLEGKLLAGHSNYDLVVPGASAFAKQLTAGVYLALDHTKLHNYRELDPSLMAKLAAMDPDNRFGIPYSWGTTGLGLNVDRILARMPDAPLDSWALFFDPDVVRKFQDCGVALLDSPGDVMPIALNYLGRNPESLSETDLDDAVALIARIQPFVRYFHSSQLFDDLANGEVCLILGWSGSVIQSRQAGEGLNLRYVIPKEGAPIWFEVMAVPADAPHIENAYRLIDHLLSPHTAAGFTSALFYQSAVTSAAALVDPAVLDDPAVYPPPAVMSRLFLDIAARVPDYERLRLRKWIAMKAGQATP